MRRIHALNQTQKDHIPPKKDRKGIGFRENFNE
jgi:hypothetical protein